MTSRLLQSKLHYSLSVTNKLDDSAETAPLATQCASAITPSDCRNSECPKEERPPLARRPGGRKTTGYALHRVLLNHGLRGLNGGHGARENSLKEQTLCFRTSSRVFFKKRAQAISA